jgi:DNA-directed RNA polymerase specialized sigma24 family protein
MKNTRFFDELTCTIETSGDKSRYWWIEEIDNPQLAKRIKMLTKDDLELITQSVIDGYSQTELAAIYGIAQKNISKKLKRIKKFISEGV